jgi:4-amino-4-deoxy-L-arabinose transferase-like glycosyltransferase
LLSRRWPTKRHFLSLFWGLPITLLVAASWYLPIYFAHGWAFIDEFFIQHHFQRYTSNKYQHPQPFYFFFWVLPLMTIPWVPFFFASIWSAFVRLYTKSRSSRDTHTEKPEASVEHSESERSIWIFATSWLLVPLVFFSFSGSKLPGYIMPAVPPAIVMTSLFVFRWAGARTVRDFFIKGLAISTFAVVIALLIFAVPKFAETDSVRSLIESADARGFSSLKVAGFHTVSHNAEFYAAGRILRAEDGTLRRLNGPTEVRTEAILAGGELLVLVPTDWAHQLESRPEFSSEIISTNGELVIAVAKPK